MTRGLPRCGTVSSTVEYELIFRDRASFEFLLVWLSIPQTPQLLCETRPARRPLPSRPSCHQSTLPPHHTCDLQQEFNPTKGPIDLSKAYFQNVQDHASRSLFFLKSPLLSSPPFPPHGHGTPLISSAGSCASASASHWRPQRWDGTFPDEIF